MRYSHYSFIFFSTMLAIASCGSEKNKEVIASDTTKEQSSTKNAKESAVDDKKPDVKFVFNTKDLEGMPSTDVSISVNGKTTFLANITGEAAMLEDIGGKNSIASCGAFWAGAGDYFYAAPSENGITIYKGWMDEEQEEPGYHWEVFKKLPI